MTPGVYGVRPYRSDDDAAIRRIMAASLAFDAAPGVGAADNDDEAHSIQNNASGVVVAVEGDVVCGYASPRHDDLTVHPQFRRRGHGRRLFSAAMDLAREAGAAHPRLYVPPAGAGLAFARAMGMAYRSSLWLMDLGSSVDVPPPAFPQGFVARPLAEWCPVERLVDLLNLCFEDYAGGRLTWTPDEVRAVHARLGDRIASTLVVAKGSPDQPIGFVSTRRPDDEDRAGTSGEIALVGVAPAWRGRGLGRELLRLGIAGLRSHGSGNIRLSVEADNPVAMGIYCRCGFEPLLEWPHWSL